MLMRRRSVVAWVGGSALLFAAAGVLLPLVGPSALDWGRVWQRQEPDWSILTQLRLSRTLLGLFAGGALALAGSLFQSMLRDALATPYTLGVSTGASLGAVIAIAFDWHMVAGVAGIWAGRSPGPALILFVVMGAATRGGQLSSSGLLLAGIAINSVCAALILAGPRPDGHVAVVRDLPLADRRARRDRASDAVGLHPWSSWPRDSSS